MMFNATGGDERYGGHHNDLGLRLGLSLGIATAEVPVDEPSSLPQHQQQQRALSVAPISPLSSAPPQCWNGFSVGSFFSQSPGMDVSSESKHHQQQAPACQGHEMPFLRGIDVNRAPAAGESRRGGSCYEDEEPGASSSPNSTLCCSFSGNGKRGGGDLTLRGAGGESEDEDSCAGAGAGGSRKKLRLSKDQAAVLEESFKEHNTLNPKQKAALAKQLNLMPRQVEVWFQNRRARTKLKQTEVDCEFLKRCCESLTEQNRRLQREVAELRALKLAAPRYGRMPPLTMCPSCVRVAVADDASRTAPTGPWGPSPCGPCSSTPRPRGHD